MTSPACTAFRNAASINGVPANSRSGQWRYPPAARLRGPYRRRHAAVGDPLAFGVTNLLQIGGINLTSVSPDATRMTHGTFFGGQYGPTQWSTPTEVWLRRDAEQIRNTMGYSGLPEKSPASQLYRGGRQP